MNEGERMRINQTDTGTIDGRIRRLARRFLCDTAPDRNQLLSLRDYCWSMSNYLAECADNIDRELRKRQRANPKWKPDRPKPSEIKAQEQQLKSFVGNDLQKLDLVEEILYWLSLFMSDPMKAQQEIERASDSSNGKKLQHAFRVLMRGKGGAPKKNDEVMPKAHEMYLAGKKIHEIARECWSDLYKEDRFKARNRMKTALYRHKKRITQSQTSTKKGT
jgi:hypothetical protein